MWCHTHRVMNASPTISVFITQVWLDGENLVLICILPPHYHFAVGGILVHFRT